MERIDRVAANREGVGAVLFDVDGVLADTARLHESAWRRLAMEEGLPFDESTAADLRGVSREASLRRVLSGREVSAGRFEEMLERKNDHYLELASELSPADVLSGVVGLLDGLGEFGIRVAAVSASRNARRVLGRLGLDARLDVIVDGMDEAQARSGVHRFLLASRRLGIVPSRCVVVEDSVAGVSAARQFGMKVVGIGSSDRLCAATMVFESLRGVDARTLLNWLGGAVDSGEPFIGRNVEVGLWMI